MTDKLVQKARALKNLRVIKRRLVAAGHHEEVASLHQQMKPHRQRLVLAYLGVKQLPDTVNATIVSEITEVAAAMAAPAEVATLCSLLRQAAWNNDVAMTRKLYHAKAQLPNLQKVQRVLATKE